MKHVVEVEKGAEGAGGRPSVGPTYRSFYAKDGFPPPIPGLDSCWDIFRMAHEKHPDNKMLGRRKVVDGKAGEYEWMTYKQVYDVVMKLSASIRSRGVEKGGRCGIFGINSPEWVMSMEACNALGAYCVPLYDTLGAGAVEFVIHHAEVQIVFVEEKNIGEVLKTFPNSTKFLKTIVSFGKVPAEQREEVEKFGLAIYSWDEFLLLGGNQRLDLPKINKTDICTVMYTSGTTGDPKGVMISNESIITLIAGVDRLLTCMNEQLKDSDVYLSYLPLAHIFDRVIEELFIFNGASIGFWRGDVKLIVEDIGALKPTIFCAVPRVLDRIYAGLQSKISSGGLLKSALFNIAYKYKFRNMTRGSKHEEAASIFDKFVFNKVKQGLGGNVRLILSGAAPLATHVEEFLRVVSCAHVLQGYGLTESCAGTFVSLPNQIAMLGTVGPPVPNVDVRLESVPEMNYDALSETPRGEICIKGKTLFSGYYKREDLTNEVMVDGWFHTGDVGEWQPDGSMKIIDRKKNIFKLSQGEYVAVENLENIYGLVSANNVVPNGHFKKHWQNYVKTWFDQPARKTRRRIARQKKAVKIFPRPTAGPLRPTVHCQTLKYNMKPRAGRGFTLEELKAAGIPNKLAPTIGIAVDHRRKNRSLEGLQANVQRLKTYKVKLVIFPRRAHKSKAGDSAPEELVTATQVQGEYMPIVQEKPTVELVKVTDEMKLFRAYAKLRLERTNKKHAGARLKRAAESEKEDKK